MCNLWRFFQAAYVGPQKNTDTVCASVENSFVLTYRSRDLWVVI